jgi:hypothetical protein
VKKDASRHVVVLNDKLWENCRIKAIREHQSLAEFIEEALYMSILPDVVEVRPSRKSKSKPVDSKKGKKID